MYSNKYNIEVRLLAITGLVNKQLYNASSKESSDSERLIEYAGRLCWDTTEKLGTNPRRIQEWINVGHESVIEHASATFYIRASRVLTHELVRHRLASYSQRSQRYVTESVPKYVEPPEIRSVGQDAENIFKKAMEDSWSIYNQLIHLGVNKEIARYVLPNACETQIVMTMNFRELRHFIKLRTSSRALPEMRAVAGEVRRIMKEQAPRVFKDL
jgi:thymidylate synthase (FAD)